MSFGELADVLGAVPAAYTTAYDPEMAGAYEAVMRDLRRITGDEMPS